MTLEKMLPDDATVSRGDDENTINKDTLNQTETKAYEYLIEHRNYDETEIERTGKDQTPDFITPDEKFEAKRAVKDSDGNLNIYLGKRQWGILPEENPIILVFTDQDTEEPHSIFRWSKRNEKDFIFGDFSKTEIVNIKAAISKSDIEKIDELIDKNIVDSREHAVRRGLSMLINEEEDEENPW